MSETRYLVRCRYVKRQRALYLSVHFLGIPPSFVLYLHTYPCLKSANLRKANVSMLCYRDAQGAGYIRTLRFSAAMIMTTVVVYAARGGPPKAQPSPPAPDWAPPSEWAQLDACPSATTFFAQKGKLPVDGMWAEPFYPYRWTMQQPRKLMINLIDARLPQS